MGGSTETPKLYYVIYEQPLTANFTNGKLLKLHTGHTVSEDFLSTLIFERDGCMVGDFRLISDG